MHISKNAKRQKYDTNSKQIVRKMYARQERKTEKNFPHIFPFQAILCAHIHAYTQHDHRFFIWLLFYLVENRPPFNELVDQKKKKEPVERIKKKFLCWKILCWPCIIYMADGLN